MNLSSRIATAALTGALALTATPALADGAASTRNIIFGAAAVGGTLLIVNHNKKVHQKYAEYDRRQAESQYERNQAEAAYVHEKQAYENEVAVAQDLQREVAYQHNAIHQRDREVASLKHSLIVAKYGRENRTAYVGRVAAPRPVRVRHLGPPQKADVARRDSPGQTVSYGWGSF